MKVTHSSESPAESGRCRDWRAIGAVVAALAMVLLLGAVYVVVRPRTMTVRIDGPPGTRYVGNINVDQQTTVVSGTVPAELKFRGRHLAFNVMPELTGVPDFHVKLADEEATGEFGVGGWYDAREGVSDVRLQPVTEEEWARMTYQYRRQMQGAPTPVP